MATADPAPIKDIILYHFPCTRSARIRWLLLELKVPHKVVRVDLYKDGHMNKEYLSKNPNHNVPMLEFTVSKTGERKTMLESGAMMIFLADTFTKPNGTKLAPSLTDYYPRSDYLQMMLFGASWMDMMLWQIRINTHLLPINLRKESVVKYYKSKWKDEVVPQLRDRLIKHKYILGDEFSCADVLIGYNLLWSGEYEMVSDPVLAKYIELLMEREEWQQAFDDQSDFQLDHPINVISPSKL